MRNSILFFSFLLVAASAQAEGPFLSLDAFLGQVKQGNQAYQSSVQVTEGASQRGREGKLIYAPSLTANAQWADDKSPKASVPAQGVETRYNTYSLGVSKLWDFGLISKLSYTVNYTNIRGANSNFLTVPIYNESKPALELSLPLLRNGFGSENEAQSGQIDSQTEAVRAGESYKVKLLLSQAEAAYWRLAAARDVRRVQRETLDRATRMVEWTSRRVGLHLADESDLRQTEALESLRRIELQAAIDEERMASRAFNVARGTDSDTVAEEVLSLETQVQGRTRIPERQGRREDTQAALAAAKAAELAARVGVEKNRPSLDVYSTLGLNGKNVALSQAVTDSLAITQPTTAIGFRFSMPLDLGLTGDDRAGYRKEAIGADLKASRAVFEEDTTWQDLVRRYHESLVRLELLRKLEESQRIKFTYERDRQSRGKSTVFVVLQFEQDYKAAQVTRLRAEAEFLTLVASMKTWSK